MTSPKRAASVSYSCRRRRFFPLVKSLVSIRFARVPSTPHEALACSLSYLISWGPLVGIPFRSPFRYLLCFCRCRIRGGSSRVFRLDTPVRFGGLPFRVEGFADDLDVFVSFESTVDLVVGVQRHMCWKCRAEGGIMIAVPRTAHRSEVRPLVFVGADVARKDIFTLMRENGSFYRSPWPIGALRAQARLDRDVGPRLVARCSFCDAEWGPSHLRGPALGIAASVRDGLPTDGFVELEIAPLRGNPVRMLDDREFCTAVISRLRTEALMGALGVDHVDRLFLPTWRGLETRSIDPMSAEQRMAFVETLPAITHEAGAFGYAFVYLERGDGGAVLPHIEALEKGRPLRGVNAFVRGRGLYHVFGEYSPDAGRLGVAGTYRITGLDSPAMTHVATSWPKRVLPLDRIVPVIEEILPAYLPIESRPPAGSGVYVIASEPENRALVVHDAVRRSLDACREGIQSRLVVLCFDEAHRARHLQLAREMLTFGEQIFSARGLTRICFAVLEGGANATAQDLYAAIVAFDYAVIAPVFDPQHVWWIDPGYRARFLARAARAARISDTRLLSSIPVGSAKMKERFGGDPYWDAADLPGNSWSIHGFPMSVPYARRYGISDDRRKRLFCCFEYREGSPSLQRWFERSASGRPVYRLIFDPSADNADVELERLLSNADVDDIFYRWRRKEFARFRPPRSARALLDAFESMSKAGLEVAPDFVFFLSKTDGCDTQAGSRIHGLAEAQRSFDPLRSRLSIGTSSLMEFYDLRADGGVDVRRRESIVPVRSYNTFALFLANLEREQAVL